LHFILSAHSFLSETMGMDMNMDMTTVDPNEPTSVHYKMWMWFHTEINDTIWFDWWHIVNVPMLIWACFIVFVFGISLELLKFIRYKVQVKLHQSNSPSSEKYFSRTISIPHLVDTFLFALQMIWGYMLMLVFMTFSVYICTSLVAGCAIGFYLFGARESLIH
ncbi:hypothetical protein PRIPAC_82771, partial [Pristionchus pacificus]